jgi:glucokinase
MLLGERPSPVTGWVVALDVGGTTMKGAIVGPDGTACAPLRRSTPCDQGPRAVVDAVGATLDLLIKDARQRGLGIAAAGVVVPGIVDDERGMAVFSANLGWQNLPLRALLEAHTGLRVGFGHDVRAGALAEATFGAARDVRDVLFLPIGAGVAGAALVDGRLLVAGGYAGEIGHISVDPAGDPCSCGGRGCVETVASGSAIARRYAERARRPVADAVEVAALVRKGDPDAVHVWDEAVAALADGLAVSVTLLAPRLVVIGGGLAGSGDPLLRPLAEGLRARLSPRAARMPQLVRAALGDQAGCLGAALLAWRAVPAGAVPGQIP